MRKVNEEGERWGLRGVLQRDEENKERGEG